MTSRCLADTFHELILENKSGLHLVDADHPLRFYVGRSEIGQLRVVIRSELKPRLLTLSDVVHVDRFTDESGTWNLALTVQDRKFDEVFIRLADDMHSRSAQGSDERSALVVTGTVLDEWRRLLKPRPTDVLSMDELRGLVGEVWLLLNVFTKDRPVAEALEGWLGPLGLPQDFWFKKDGYFEAKAIGPSTRIVRISSESQLDVEDLNLFVLVVANANETAPAIVNLPGLVAVIEAKLEAEGVGPEPVRDRLNRLGVDLNTGFYSDTWFVVASAARYEVTRDFPAIRASELPAGVHHVSYQVDLDSVLSFRRSILEVT